MKHRQTKQYRIAIGIVLLAASNATSAVETDHEIQELRKQNVQLTELVEKQSAEIALLKTRLDKPKKLRTASSTNKQNLLIRKPFDKISISKEESEAFQATYIQLFSTRFNETECSNLKFLFKKYGSKVVMEEHFDPFSADRSTQLYKTEIRYEFADPRCLVTCNLIKRILEERYGIEDIPIIHETQYHYKGERRYIEVYICENMDGQTAEFKDKKLPLRFW